MRRSAVRDLQNVTLVIYLAPNYGPASRNKGDMPVIARFALTATLAFSAATFAQGASAGAPPVLRHLVGTVTAIDAAGITLKGNDGTETRITIGPNVTWLGARPVGREEIKPGKTAVTGARIQPDGTQRSYGFRLIEPGSPVFGPGGGPAPLPGATVTSGTVTKVTRTAAGDEIDLAYDGGTRHVLLPAEVQAVSSFSADRTLLKVGGLIHALVAGEPNKAVNADEIVVMLPAKP